MSNLRRVTGQFINAEFKALSGVYTLFRIDNTKSAMLGTTDLLGGKSKVWQSDKPYRDNTSWRGLK